MLTVEKPSFFILIKNQNAFAVTSAGWTGGPRNARTNLSVMAKCRYAPAVAKPLLTIKSKSIARMPATSKIDSGEKTMRDLWQENCRLVLLLGILKSLVREHGLTEKEYRRAVNLVRADEKHTIEALTSTNL